MILEPHPSPSVSTHWIPAYRHDSIGLDRLRLATTIAQGLRQAFSLANILNLTGERCANHFPLSSGRVDAGLLAPRSTTSNRILGR